MSVYDERMKRGLEIMEKLGRGGRNQYQKELYPDWYELTVGHLFGEIWARPHLNLRDRSLITLAANIALIRPYGAKSHYVSAQHVGITKEEIMELIIHVGTHAGWEAMAIAARQFSEVLKEEAEKAKKSIK